MDELLWARCLIQDFKLCPVLDDPPVVESELVVPGPLGLPRNDKADHVLLD